MANEQKRIASAAVREAIVEYAREQVGAHYVMGAAGNTPGNADGAWYRPDTVKLHENDPKGKPPFLFAATRSGEKKHVCGGRYSCADVKKLSQGDPANAAHTVKPSGYRWERPARYEGAKDSVFGECCAGIRHFDCIGFVNWVLGHVQQNHRGIPQWIAKTTEVGLTEIQAGDILTTGDHHIGIATSATHVVHASDTQWGVIEQKISTGSWDRYGRVKESFWLKYGLTSEEVIGDAMIVDFGLPE